MRMTWIALAALSLAACLGDFPAPDSNGNGSPPPPPAAPPAATPPSSQPPPPAPVWVRGSLNPLYQLTPKSEYPRIQQQFIPMTDFDFAALFTAKSAAAKMDELGAQLAAERGQAAPIDLIPDADDRARSQKIPFRGNPSDVKLANGKAYVPLGGDVMTPGNEVAAVSPTGSVTRIQVGIRPQRLAVHSSGLVFVCNQYSNYISIIDSNTDSLLTKNGAPVEIKSEHFCADLLIKDKAGVADTSYLYVANRWRHSVLKYLVQIVRDANGRPIDVQSQANATPANAPLAELTGVGANPWRLGLSEDGSALYVANNKGGEMARVDLASATVTARVGLNAPTADVVAVGGALLIPTTTPNRGLLYAGDPVPPEVQDAPVSRAGLDGQPHVVWPGAQLDATRSYNFEDLRNGMFQIDPQLTTAPAYYTDDVAGEPNFRQSQRVLAGALPTTIVKNANGDRVYVALGGSDRVQELAFQNGALTATGRVFHTAPRPFGLALDDGAGVLYVANWGGETLETFDLASGQRTAAIDLGYAQPPYPATNIERGEYWYYNAEWSNNGRKACATCHFDELDTDGIGYSNGASAPTLLHQVKPNHNLMTTNSYFWNGSFGDGNYTSLAFAAQTRTNCEVIEFGLVEGPASNPDFRQGDPFNRFSDVNDGLCRPISNGIPGNLANQQDIDTQDAADKLLVENTIENVTGFDRESLSRVIDFYSVAELRLPPNPLRQMYDAAQLDAATMQQIQDGRNLFAVAGCAGCHTPGDTRHPFSDGLDHGRGADWTSRFIKQYQADPRVVLNVLGGVPLTMRDSQSTSKPDPEMNYYGKLDYFAPFCFELGNCLVFEDPLAARGDFFEESRRLDLIVRINLADEDRGFVPGAVVGQPVINTPSLRGVWTQANLGHHGAARSVGEAVLGPGHRALQPGEVGWASDALGALDVHGTTSTLTVTQAQALFRYVESIE